jgi:hypothetical protein
VRHAFCIREEGAYSGSAGEDPVSTIPPPVHEANPWTTPLRDLGLTIIGTPLDRVLQDFQHELKARGLIRIAPKFYLSTEWGVPFGTISIAIPF